MPVMVKDVSVDGKLFFIKKKCLTGVITCVKGNTCPSGVKTLQQAWMKML